MSNPSVSSGDRLGVTALFSIIVHGVLILGLTFDMPLPRPALPSLDVTLVQTANRQTPEHADFLAQVDNQGGGNSDRPALPSRRFSSELPKPDPGDAPRQMDPSAPQPQPAHGPQVLTTSGASKQQAKSEPDSRRQPERDLQASPEEVRRHHEMARLAAEVRDKSRQYAQRPKIKFLSASTRQYEFAAYMHAWVQRVQHIGNLNYPEEARKRHLEGSLILSVILARDGSIKSAKVVESSGDKLLDAAALRIVRLSGPFPPLPDTSESYDEFNITRTWQFLASGKLRTHG